VHFTPSGRQPEPAKPQQQTGRDGPERGRPAIVCFGDGAVQIKGEHHDGDESAGDSEHLQDRQIHDAIAAGAEVTPAERLDANQFRAPFEKRQPQEEEAGEGQQPHTDGVSTGNASADDSNGEHKRQAKHVHQRPLF